MPSSATYFITYSLYRSLIFIEELQYVTMADNTIADHSPLFTHRRCSITRVSIIQDVQAGQYPTARTRLQRAYETCFGLDSLDWKFLRSLAAVRNAMTTKTILTRGDSEGDNCLFTDLLKGHAPNRDFFDADIEGLFKAGLLRQPRICGETRTRIIYKPYYVLTPEATDCITAGTVGLNVGDLGETVVHAVGARLYGQYMRQRVSNLTGYDVMVEYYDDLLLDSHDVDVAVYVRPPDQANGRDLYAVGEVKTTLSADSEAINSLYKMGALREPQCKHWIVPRRELINRIVNVAALRGWYSLDRVPETLALENSQGSGIRSTNERIEDSEYIADQSGGPLTTPITKGFSYTMLYRELKQMDPSLFDAPRVKTE